LPVIVAALKFELLVPLRGNGRPTACMSFNYHKDHFGAAWGLRNETGEVAHTSCVAFGIDRLTLALFVTHGLEPAKWPDAVRKLLGL
jgi:seryl-tRNA synthetase